MAELGQERGRLSDSKGHLFCYHAKCLLVVSSFFFLICLFYLFYFWLRWVFVAARRLSLVAASGGYSSLAVHGLLIVVASLVAEHGL